MKTVDAYLSKDGQLFFTKEQCEMHDLTIDIEADLKDMANTMLGTAPFISDWGCNAISDEESAIDALTHVFVKYRAKVNHVLSMIDKASTMKNSKGEENRNEPLSGERP